MSCTIETQCRPRQKLKSTGTDIVSEIEFAGRYTSAKKICITGSNGKTTTTMLIWHILKKAGLNVGLAGNIGQSFAMQVAHNRFDYYVLEISSFQLDGIFDFKADIAILMNITPDHLDRYDNKFQNYVDSKFRIIKNQTNQDAFIYCADDPVIIREIKKKSIKSELFPFSLRNKVPFNGAYSDGNNIYINIKPNFIKMTIESLALQGKHNIFNSMAASVAARILDIRKDVVKESLTDFQNVEHRLEYVARIHGIDFINDSKATNVNSTWYALESMQKPVIWIAGGIDKGNDYSVLENLVQEKVKVLICLGNDYEKLVEAFEDKVDLVVHTKTMDEAVGYAVAAGSIDDVVLLSPSCASFDLFENYEERGDKFKKAVA